MKLEELESSLPNGFHDAILRAIHIDYVTASASLVLDVDVGEVKANEDRYRRARVNLSGLLFFSIESPERLKDLWPPDGLMIDAGPGRRSEVPPSPDSAFVHWFYVVAWNSFIHVAAHEASISWE